MGKTIKITARHKSKWTKVPILNDEYCVIVVFGPPEAVQMCLSAWHYTPEAVAEVHREMEARRGACFHMKGCNPVIALPRRPTNSEEWGTLAHEACHAVEDIFNHIGQPIGGEVFAHSVGAIVRLAGLWRPSLP